MEELLLARIKGATAVAALAATRVNWNLRPQNGSLPAVTLKVISAPGDYTLAGPSGLIQARVQIDSWGTSYGSARALQRAVRACVDGWKSGAILGVFVDSERDLPNDEQVNIIFGISTDVMVSYKQP